jgi:hypothetical protein
MVQGMKNLPLSCRTDPLRLGLPRPRVPDRFGGQDQAPPDCGSVTPERVERRVLVVPGFQAREGRLVDPTTPGDLGQGESSRLAGPLGHGGCTSASVAPLAVTWAATHQLLRFG